MNTSIMTQSGNYFDYLNPEGSDFTIDDIAFALSNTCRFGGHVKFYSVAQHCVYVCDAVAYRNMELAALMHDAAEAFVGDCPTPLKSLLPDYKLIEINIHAAIMKRFGLPLFNTSPAIKTADLQVLAAEKRDLLPSAPGDKQWLMSSGIEPAPFTIKPLSPADAYTQFMEYFEDLTSG